jgi:4-methyl-5(b-hydroxyethyl)-thiazole monophosphate biosynthesis
MKRALVLLADGSEEMEAVTVIDILRRAKIEVVVAGLKEGPITASRGIRLIPDAVLEGQEISQFDLLVLPGGNAGTHALEEDPRVVQMVRMAATLPIILAAVCAAPRVLHRAGVLAGKHVTSYPGALQPTDETYHYHEQGVVVDGRLITSRGPGTALDFALKIVEELLGPAARQAVEVPLIRVS